MNSNASSSPSSTSSSSILAEENALLREQVQVLTHQLDWFKKQLFGPKSEKQVLDMEHRGQVLSFA
ncbi:transposase [Alloalcanivorax balearicus]|nr:transposase [Alloalcanivorax balearicus]